MIDHPPGGHDDLANVTAGAVTLCKGTGTISFKTAIGMI